MEYQRLGTTDLVVSRIAFGCWAIGGHGYGRVDDKLSIAAIRTALDAGINFFDTADVYGFGHSEEILAEALGEHRNKLIIATKFGVGWNEKGETYIDCKPQRLVRALEASLLRLKLDCIPLYQIHWPDKSTPLFDTMAALKRCQDEGKIRYISCSNFPLAAIREAMREHRVESLQCLYNLVQRYAEPDMVECATRFQMGTIAYGILARGLLSGKHTVASRFGENDTRGRYELCQPDKIDRVLRIVAELNHVGLWHGKTSAQVAIRFVLQHPAVTCALVGMKTREQVKENVDTMDWKLDRNEMDLIEHVSGSGMDLPPAR